MAHRLDKEKFLKNDETALHCVQCGACEAACPQHLNIIEELQTAWAEITK